MEIVKPSYEILAMTGYASLPYSYDGFFASKLIEVAGRTCYKSEKEITGFSSDKFIAERVKSGHLAIIEHSWEARAYRINGRPSMAGDWSKYLYFSKHVCHNNPSQSPEIIIAGNCRAWNEAEKENRWLVQQPHRTVSENELRNWAHEKDEPSLMGATIRLIVDRGVSHEIVRHRPISVCQESTRYVNYSKRGIRFILPSWVKRKNFSLSSLFNKERRGDMLWLVSVWLSGKFYNQLLKHGWTPQQARSVLPNSTKTELIISGSLSEWQHIFRLRALGTTGKPHPQTEEAMNPLLWWFQKLEPEFFDDQVLRYRTSDD